MSMRHGLVPDAVTARGRRAGNFSAGFGRRFLLLFLVGLAWAVAGFLRKEFYFAMAAWDGLLFLAWCIDLMNIPRPASFEVSRSFEHPLTLAETSQVTVTLSNLGKSFVLAEAMDSPPPELCHTPPVLMFGVRAGGMLPLAYAAHPMRRGEVRFGNVYLRCQTAFGLAQRWVVVRLQQNVQVYPGMGAAKRESIYLLRSRQIELQQRKLRHRGMGKDFESLREFRDGDELRDVCWTATARRGKLVTKVHQVERSQAVWVVLDCGRLMRARVGGLTKLDYAIGAALSLSQLALFSGDRVAVLAYGVKVQQRTGLGRGRSHMGTILDQLSRIREEVSEADHERAASTLMTQQKRRSLVVWITDLAETSLTPEVISAATQLAKRHLVLLVVIGNSDLEQLARERPSEVAEMYRFTAALEMVQRRELLLARMRQHGAIALEIGPRGASTAILNKYLEVKERSRL